MDIKQLSYALSARAEQIAGYLLPNGRKRGNEWCAGNTNGEAGRSLKVHLAGSKAGVFADFAANESGDLLDLWQAVKGCSLHQAIREAKGYLGIQEPEFIERRPKTYSKPIRPDCKRPSAEGRVFRYLTEVRGLTAETLKAFQIAEMTDDRGGIIVFPFKRDDALVNVKYLRVDRPEGKKISWTAENCELILFGWQAFQPKQRSLIICEGEIDAMTWSQYGLLPALSVPYGATSHGWVENEYEQLECFETIYLSFDMDDAGKKGIAALIDRLGAHRCRIVKLPFKDANECLINGIDAFHIADYIDKAESCDPKELKAASSFRIEVIESFYPSDKREYGFDLPFSRLNGRFKFRPSEMTVWTGFNTHGKTTLLAQTINHSIRQGETACIASLETRPQKLLNKMIRQLTGKREPEIGHIEAAINWYQDKLFIFNLVGTVDTQRLLQVWDYARRRYGITQFALDNLTRCDIADEDLAKQKAFINHLLDFAIKHNVHVHLAAHARKKNDDTTAPNRMDVKGSGSITDLAHNVFAIWKNKEKANALEKALQSGLEVSPLILQEPDGVLYCDKQREGDWEASIDLWFDRESQQFLQAQGDWPLVYVADFETEEVYIS